MAGGSPPTAFGTGLRACSGRVALALKDLAISMRNGAKAGGKARAKAGANACSKA